MPRAERSPAATSLGRGLRALELLAGDRSGLGVLEVARRLGVDKSQASRTLRTLAEHGLIERDPATLSYHLGARLFAYAARVSHARLLRCAPPLLERLVTRLGERSHLSVLDGTHVLTLLSHSPPQAVQAVGWEGRTVPAHNTASGRALLLDHDAEALRALFAGLELPGDAPRAPGDLDVLAGRIADARRRGRVRVEEELEAGLVAVAAPVRRFDGRIVAALNVSGPQFRFASRLDAAEVEVQLTADELSGLLAGTAEPGAAGPAPAPRARTGDG